MGTVALACIGAGVAYGAGVASTAIKIGSAAAGGAASAGASEVAQQQIAINAAGNAIGETGQEKKNGSEPDTKITEQEEKAQEQVTEQVEKAQENATEQVEKAQEQATEQTEQAQKVAKSANKQDSVDSRVTDLASNALESKVDSAKKNFSEAWHDVTHPGEYLEDKLKAYDYKYMKDIDKDALSDEEKSEMQRVLAKQEKSRRRMQELEQNNARAKELFASTLEASRIKD